MENRRRGSKSHDECAILWLEEKNAESWGSPRSTRSRTRRGETNQRADSERMQQSETKDPKTQPDEKICPDGELSSAEIRLGLQQLRQRRDLKKEEKEIYKKNFFYFFW